MMFRGILALVLGVAAVAAAVPASARTPAPQQLRIGMGNGLAFLPVYIAAEQKLFEKHARAAGLNLKPVFQRLQSSSAMQQALLSGQVDVAPFGVSALLRLREQRPDVVVVSGLSTLPMLLVANRADVKTLADFSPADRIAMPLLAGPQMYVLRMRSEQSFGAGQAERLRGQVVALPHAEAIAALEDRKSGVAGYFASPPFAQIALQRPGIHKVLSSAEVLEGRASFLLLAATRTLADGKLPQVLIKAIDEAAAIIARDPHRAALTFLTFEPSRSLDPKTLDAVLRELKDDFGAQVHGIEAYARFMARQGTLKDPPKSWKDIVAQPVARLPGS
jgi:NitT/TauT family transport system substrate-binding protein